MSGYSVQATLLFILLGSFLLGSGIVCVILAAYYGSFHALWTIYFHGTACIWPFCCSGCQPIWGDLGWYLTGMFLMSGFSMPLLMFHNYIVPIDVALLSIGGSALMISGVLIFLRLFYKQEQWY